MVSTIYVQLGTECMLNTNTRFAMCARDEGQSSTVETFFDDIHVIETVVLRWYPGPRFLIRITCLVKGVPDHVPEARCPEPEGNEGLQSQEFVPILCFDFCFVDHRICDVSYEWLLHYRLCSSSIAAHMKWAARIYIWSLTFSDSFRMHTRGSFDD